MALSAGTGGSGTAAWIGIPRRAGHGFHEIIRRIVDRERQQDQVSADAGFQSLVEPHLNLGSFGSPKSARLPLDCRAF